MLMTPDKIEKSHNHTLRFPLYLYTWAKQKARNEGKTMSQVVFDSMREQMKRDQREQPDRK